eukprot:CAMPEP_0185757102 /NCGR_PEP_ID=MMETSP1174-20130828/15540_1 /TAXON_ID=35687 /ORGANISM="Dictyocha speculum, Strain CCMP1381" /LENGTH=205 /DNA_ID=CAMNT_0028436373 /DNA_START=33 /DNA_END=650 /DNA_ORIENTATION=-
MKVIQLSVYRYMRDTNEPVLLSEAIDLNSFGYFQRATVQQVTNAFSKIVVKRIEPSQRITVEVEGLADYQVHTYVRSDGLAATLTGDTEYPTRVAFAVLNEVLDSFSTDPYTSGWEGVVENNAFGRWVPLNEKLATCQDPASFDKILRIQNDLQSTQKVLHSTIDNLLERGEKLDDLVQRSDELSATSKQFYRQARKSNSCCVIS